TTHTTTVQLMVADSAPGTANLLTPADMATGISITPDFSWSTVAGASSYFLEVADDINFTNIIYTADVNGTSHTLPGANALDYLTWHYWRVTTSNACGSGTTSAQFSFQTVEQPNTFCSAPNLPIPDSGSVNDTITTGTSGNILDVDIYVDVPHTWVGDLIFTVNHNSTNAIIIDRPGYSGAGFGCSGNDYDVTVNDEGPDGNIESQCADAPAIFGDRVGGDPVNSSLLATYDGMDFSGDWTLTITDNAGGDIGTLVQWCVVPTLEEGGPGVDLSPNQADSGAPGTVVTYTMSVTNTGSAVDTFDLTADAQWDTQLSDSEITLNAGEVGTFTAAVTVPANAMAGDMGTSQVTATSQSDGSVSDDAFLMTTATAVYGITLSADPTELSDEPGAVLTYTVHLTNTGNTTDTFSLSTVDDNGWMSHVEPVSVTLAAGEMGSVMVMVHVPGDAADGEMNVTTVTAVSDSDAAATATVDLTSTAGAPSYMIYLPIILKP
ncbi:MAG: hypothetical protein HC804_03145, partial [Anaerolineae bacterium]|nr:hypothetical protein [Anaerolineae bacterium]